MREGRDRFLPFHRTSDEDFNASLKDIIKRSDWVSTSRYGYQFQEKYAFHNYELILTLVFWDY